MELEMKNFVHVNYEDAKKEFFKECPNLNNEINAENLDQYMYAGVQYRNNRLSVKMNLDPIAYHSDLFRIFILWLNSKNILLLKEKEIYLDV